ncbi:MAG: hypothetical protein HY319_25385 [Armatimonadetes bacterium]|nr:hypothetical protein [Armatimonadota bacterium]
MNAIRSASATPRVNVITLFDASNLLEAREFPYETLTLEGKVTTTTLSDMMDLLEQAKKELGASYEGTVLTTGAGGRRLFSVRADQAKGVVDSERLTPPAGPEQLNSEELAEYIASHWNPDAINIVHVRGHGHADLDVAGMPTSEFVKGLQGASRRIGGKLGVVLLESCIMANLQALKGMQGCTPVVVASEEVLGTTALPLPRLIADVAEGGGTPQEIAQRMLTVTAVHGKADTLAMIDVDRLGELDRSYQNLAGQLKQETQAGQGDEVRAALKKCDLFPRRWNDYSQKSLRGQLQLRDLGEVAHAVQESHLSEQTRQAAARVEETLGQAVRRITSANYEKVAGFSVKTGDVLPSQPWSWNPLRWLGFID